VAVYFGLNQSIIVSLQDKTKHLHVKHMVFTFLLCEILMMDWFNLKHTATTEKNLSCVWQRICLLLFMEFIMQQEVFY